MSFLEQKARVWNFKKESRFGTHSFRRGALQHAQKLGKFTNVLDSREQQLRATGMWKSKAIDGYKDLPFEEQLHALASFFESSDEEEVDQLSLGWH